MYSQHRTSNIFRKEVSSPISQSGSFNLPATDGTPDAVVSSGTTSTDSVTQVGHWRKPQEGKVVSPYNPDIVVISATSLHLYAVSESAHLSHSSLRHPLSHKMSVDPGAPSATAQMKLNSVPFLLKLDPVTKLESAVNECLGRGRRDFLDMGVRSGSPWQAISPVLH